MGEVKSKEKILTTKMKREYIHEQHIYKADINLGPHFSARIHRVPNSSPTSPNCLESYKFKLPESLCMSMSPCQVPWPGHVGILCRGLPPAY